MATQTALALTEIGKPLTKITLPIPDPSDLKDHEVLIRVTAAGLPPLDQKFRDQNFFNIGARLPAVIGSSLVGTVVANGPHATLPLGAHVFSQMLFHLPHSGGLQHYTIIDARYAAVVPPRTPDAAAALYPVAAVTAATALFSPAGLALPFPGTPASDSFDYDAHTLLVLGAGTATGQLAVQLARLAGIGTIVATASPARAALLKSFGATHVVARQDADVEAQVRRIVGGGVRCVYDAVGSDHGFGIALLSRARGGTLVHNDPGAADAAVLVGRPGVVCKHVQGFSHAVPEFGRMLWERLPGWLESGEIAPLGYRVIEGLYGERVNEALDEYRDGRGGDHYHVRMV